MSTTDDMPLDVAHRADVTKSAGRTIQVRSPISDRMKVYHLRQFVRALDAEGISDEVQVDAHRSENFHLTHLSVQVHETLPYEVGDRS